MIKKRNYNKEKRSLFYMGCLVFINDNCKCVCLSRACNRKCNNFSAVDKVSHFGFFYWLNPVTWGKCIKWSLIYWLGIAMFLIYEEKWAHDMDGKENGSAHWNDKVEEYNETHSEPFGEKTFSDDQGCS